MKKLLLLFIVVLPSMIAFGQSSSKGVLEDPAVSITATDVDSLSFTVQFTPNAECSYYYYLAMSLDEISMWTTMLGMDVEQLIPFWGADAFVAESHTWSDMEPNTTYRMFALPYDADSVSYNCSYIELTTLAIGGTGNSVIEISVSNITDSSVVVLCTPNSETAAFYDGLVTVDLYNEIGQDSVCTILRENMAYPNYSAYSWEWLSLTPNTQYYAIAFGHNADGVWGDTTVYMFQTLASVAVDDHVSSKIDVFPMPNDGNFVIAGDDLDGANAMLYSLNGQLLKSISLSSNSNNVSVSLPAGSYLLVVRDFEGKQIGRNVVVIR